MTIIKVKRTSCDGARDKRTFKSLQRARAYAQYYAGKHPEMGSTYAISGDGIVKIEVDGCTLRDLFPNPGI